MAMRQGCNKVWDQRPKLWDSEQGSEGWDLGSQSMGLGSADVLRIREQGSGCAISQDRG